MWSKVGAAQAVYGPRIEESEIEEEWTDDDDGDDDDDGPGELDFEGDEFPDEDEWDDDDDE